MLGGLGGGGSTVDIGNEDLFSAGKGVFEQMCCLEFAGGHGEVDAYSCRVEVFGKGEEVVVAGFCFCVFGRV